MEFWGRPKADHVKALIHPVDGYRGKLEAKGIEPKNHFKLNQNTIKQIEQGCLKAKVKDEMMRNYEPFKMTKFKNVDPKLKTQSKRPKTAVPKENPALTKENMNILNEIPKWERPQIPEEKNFIKKNLMNVTM